MGWLWQLNELLLAKGLEQYLVYRIQSLLEIIIPAIVIDVIIITIGGI